MEWIHNRLEGKGKGKGNHSELEAPLQRKSLTSELVLPETGSVHHGFEERMSNERRQSNCDWSEETRQVSFPLNVFETTDVNEEFLSLTKIDCSPSQVFNAK